MRFLILVPALVCYTIISCSQKKTRSGKDLMPEMEQTDSIQIIYFKSPEETRYFTFAAVGDREFINILVRDVLKQTQAGNPCPKEGKIYCYKKGEIFNTIFFAYEDNNCTFLRYIKNGHLYYFEMSREVKKYLLEYKSSAVSPKPDN